MAAVHIPNLEAQKGALLGQHCPERVCPAQGGSAGAAEPPRQFLWAGKGSGAGVTGATGHAGQQHDAPSMGTSETVCSVLRPLILSKDLSENPKNNSN